MFLQSEYLVLLPMIKKSVQCAFWSKLFQSISTQQFLRLYDLNPAWWPSYTSQFYQKTWVFIWCYLKLLYFLLGRPMYHKLLNWLIFHAHCYLSLPVLLILLATWLGDSNRKGIWKSSSRLTGSMVVVVLIASCIFYHTVIYFLLSYSLFISISSLFLTYCRNWHDMCVWQVSRVADVDETFSDISEYVSLIITSEQSSSLWQLCAAVTKPDIEITDSRRKQDLPACPVVSLYGISCAAIINVLVLCISLEQKWCP